MGNDDGDREGRLQQMTHQANLILQKANDEKRDYLVRALTKSVETNTKIRGLLQTSLSETDLSYSIQMEDAYTMAVQMVNDLRRVIQIGDGIIVKNGEAKRYGRIIEPFDVPVEIHYINGLFKIQIPTLPSRGIKKDSDLKAIEDAVHNAIERFFEYNVEIAAQARKFFCFLYVVVNVRCNRLLLILYLPRLKRKCQWDHGICARYGHLCRESPLHFFASVWQPFCKLP